MGLFGGSSVTVPPPPMSNPTTEAQAAEFAKTLTGYAPGEEELLQHLDEQARLADQGVLDEQGRLRERGDALDTLDQSAFDRAYTPALRRLMDDYQNADQGVMSNLNARGIASSNGVESEPESYARSYLARERDREMGNVALDAQNQAMTQQINRYNARLAETGQANERYGQTMNPLIEAKVTPESERMQNRTSLTSNTIGQRLGQQTQQNAINSQRKMTTQQQNMSLIGAGLGAAGMAFASDPDTKENIQPPDPQAPERDLEEVRGMGLKRWNYKGDPTPREGPMANEVPEEVQANDGHAIDVQGIVSKLIGAVQGLDQKIERQYGNGLRSVAAR